MAKITKRTVDALEPRDREHVLWDDEIRGIGQPSPKPSQPSRQSATTRFARPPLSRPERL